MKKTCKPERIVSQLHRIEGQVRAVEKMYNEKRNIEDIICQVKAARASLDSVTKLLVDDKVSGCYDGSRVAKKKELLKLIDVLFDVT
ncbi:MAG: metal-sensing transcriptional repressor [Candidatus Komeilibacteria bacterium]|nr:metal-sensing transcriptional repressor [Candidatus Komeilibacteria bacterium]MBT4447210.1 metal-sensing transcriptional repressor [Candidatus Komeilibacteria bacterium]